MLTAIRTIITEVLHIFFIFIIIIIGIIVGGFIVCWLPFFTMYVVRAFCAVSKLILYYYINSFKYKVNLVTRNYKITVKHSLVPKKRHFS